MLRVKDPEKSLKFYQEVLGMTLMRTIENKEPGFNLYYLGYLNAKTAAAQTTADYEGLLQLTWEYGTENNENFKYHNGNEEPQGFGHICKHSH
jgi:lactoylglutathione lyase